MKESGPQNRRRHPFLRAGWLSSPCRHNSNSPAAAEAAGLLSWCMETVEAGF